MDNNSDVTISLVNITGKTIRQETFSSVTGDNALVFSCPEVAPGLYLVNVHYGNKVMNAKLIVN